MAKNKKKIGEEYIAAEAEYKPTGDTFVDAKAQALSDQNYKAYYNQLIQNRNANELAQKYLNNELARQGLDTQGYGSSARVGLNTDFINAYNKGEQDYLNRQQEIQGNAQTELGQRQTEQDNILVENIKDTIYNGGTIDDVNKFLVSYGYKDNDGNYTEKWNALDDMRKQYIEGSFASVNGSSGKNAINIGDLNSQITYYDKDGAVKSDTIDNKFKYETQTLLNNANVGNIKNGDVIALRNIWDDMVYVKYINGNIYYTTKAEFDKSGDNGKVIYGQSGKVTNK